MGVVRTLFWRGFFWVDGGADGAVPDSSDWRWAGTVHRFAGDAGRVSGNIQLSESSALAIVEDAMGKLWSREHLERRVERYYMLAAATKVPEIRQSHIGHARRYRELLSAGDVMAS